MHVCDSSLVCAGASIKPIILVTSREKLGILLAFKLLPLVN